MGAVSSPHHRAWHHPGRACARAEDPGGGSGCVSPRQRLASHLTALGRERRERLLATMEALAKECHLVFVDEHGTDRALVSPLPPGIIRADAYEHLRRSLDGVMRKVYGVLWSSPLDGELRPFFPVDEEEESFLSRGIMASAGLAGFTFPRLDGVAPLDRADWHRHVRLVEVNLSVVGGISLAPLSERITLAGLATVGRRSGRHVAIAGLAVGILPDPRDLFDKALDAFAKDVGLLRPLRLGLVEDTTLPAGEDPLRPLAEHLVRRGRTVVCGDVRAVEMHHGMPHVDGREVDFIYRYLELREALELRRAGAPVDGFLMAWEAGRVIPLAECDLDHKALFDPLTDPDSRHFLPPPAGRLLTWTRLLTARRTRGPTGAGGLGAGGGGAGRDARVDLPAYVESRREQLVIKPNRSCGGEGVIVGSEVTSSTWRAAIDDAVRRPGSAVAQERVGPYPATFLAQRDGSTRSLCPVLGFYLAGRSMGILGRVSGDTVVNVSRGGTLLPILRLAR